MAHILDDPYPERRLPEYCWRSWPPRHTDDCGCTTVATPPGPPQYQCEACGQTLPRFTSVAPSAPAGWTCPSCGHSYAPWVPECHHCPEPPAFIAKGADPGPIEMGR